MAYERVNWENLPSTKTPINQTNLNKMENGIDQAGAEIFVGTEEPTAGEKVWFNKNKNSIYVRNSKGVYEEFTKKSEEEIVLYENTSGLANGGAGILKKSVSKYKILGVYTSTGYEIIYYGGLTKNCWGNKTALYFFNNGNAFNVYNTTLYKIVALY